MPQSCVVTDELPQLRARHAAFVVNDTRKFRFLPMLAANSGFVFLGRRVRLALCVSRGTAD